MKISLNAFNDLGKCSMGTSLDEFDTEKHHIIVRVKEVKTWTDFSKSYAEVKINSVDDLAMWLWNIAGCSTGGKDGDQKWFFTDCEDWWYCEYGRRLEKNKKKFVMYSKKLERATDEVTYRKLQDKVNLYDTTWIEKTLEDHDKRKLEIIEKLRKENENGLHT